jgi:hypothetical protein
MSMRKTHHVVPSGSGGWNVKKGGADRASKHFDIKTSAIDYARSVSIAQGTELLIHGKDGRIQQADSHGKDPCPPKDN